MQVLLPGPVIGSGAGQQVIDTADGKLFLRCDCSVEWFVFLRQYGRDINRVKLVVLCSFCKRHVASHVLMLVVKKPKLIKNQVVT